MTYKLQQIFCVPICNHTRLFFRNHIAKFKFVKKLSSCYVTLEWARESTLNRICSTGATFSNSPIGFKINIILVVTRMFSSHTFFILFRLPSLIFLKKKHSLSSINHTRRHRRIFFYTYYSKIRVYCLATVPCRVAL